MNKFRLRSRGRHNIAGGITLVLLGGWVGVCWGAQPVSPWFRAYQTTWNQAEEAYARRDFSAAAGHYELVAQLLPHEPLTRFRWACCLALQGQADRAFEELNASVRAGWDDPERIAEAEELTVLREDSRFQQCLAQARACRDEDWIISAAQDVDPQEPHGVLLLLHGLGCGPRSEVPYWMATAEKMKLIVVAPRATTRVASMLYGWQPQSGTRMSTSEPYYDVAAAVARIDQSLAAAAQRFAIDSDRVVLAGFSQGGGVALHVLREQSDRFRGAVVVNCRYPAGPARRWPQPRDGGWPRVQVLAGQLDPLVPDSRRAVEELAAASVPHRFVELPETGHEYPADFSAVAAAALQRILEPESR